MRRAPVSMGAPCINRSPSRGRCHAAAEAPVVPLTPIARDDRVTLNQTAGTFTGRLTVTDDSGTMTFPGITFGTR